MDEDGWPESHPPDFRQRQFKPHQQIHPAASKGHVHPMIQRPTTLQKAIDSRRLSQARNQNKKVALSFGELVAPRALT